MHTIAFASVKSCSSKILMESALTLNFHNILFKSALILHPILMESALALHNILMESAIDLHNIFPMPILVYHWLPINNPI